MCVRIGVWWSFFLPFLGATGEVPSFRYVRLRVVLGADTEIERGPVGRERKEEVDESDSEWSVLEF